MIRNFVGLLTLAASLVSTSPTPAAEWTLDLGATATPAAKVEIASFRYGKTWAYAIEIDDGPQHAKAVAQPMFAQFAFTDAPPGVAGGKRMPFVGGIGLIVGSTGTTNATHLSWDDIRGLQQAGWGVINHSYLHAGRTWGNPPELLTKEQFRRDLFWSQTILATETGGRAPTHFIYPNGYTDYRHHFAEFGLRSGSRVAGARKNWNVYDDKADFTDLDRSYLDEGAWSNAGKADPAHNLASAAQPGHVFLDFTHGIDKDPASPNHQRWLKRLEAIETQWGAKGDDSVWCAPTGEVMEYVAARKAAKATIDSGKLKVTIPDDAPGTRLTLQITGIDPNAKRDKWPAEVIAYVHNDALWLTTPIIGTPGALPPMPRVARIYAGEVKDLQWDAPVAIAAVRIQQSGPSKDATFKLQLTATGPDGATTQLVPEDQQTLGKRWGAWLLIDRVPNAEPVQATSLAVTKNPSLTQMEVWVQTK